MNSEDERLGGCPVMGHTTLREYTGTIEERREEEQQKIRRPGSIGNTSITAGGNQAGVLDGITRASMDPVVITNSKGRILAVNQECLDLFGYRRWELATKNVKIMMPHSIAKHHDHFLARYARTGVKKIIGEKRAGKEIMGKKKDGSFFPITLKVVEISDTKFGSVFLGTIRDDSAKIKLQNITKTFESLYPTAEIEKKVYKGETEISASFNTTVGFIDVCGFTKRSEEILPEILVRYLGRLFSGIDVLASEMEMIKIKTIGDCYMFTTNAKEMEFHENGALKAICFCRRVMKKLSLSRELIKDIEEDFGRPLALHIGIATGRVTGGVLEGKIRTYDVWGSPCNLGSRLLDCAREGEIMVDRKTMEMTSFLVDYKSNVCQIEGIGELEAFKAIQFKKEASRIHRVHSQQSSIKKKPLSTRNRRVSKKKGMVVSDHLHAEENTQHQQRKRQAALTPQHGGRGKRSDSSTGEGGVRQKKGTVFPRIVNSGVNKNNEKFL